MKPIEQWGVLADFGRAAAAATFRYRVSLIHHATGGLNLTGLSRPVLDHNGFRGTPLRQRYCPKRLEVE